MIAVALIVSLCMPQEPCVYEHSADVYGPTEELALITCNAYADVVRKRADVAMTPEQRQWLNADCVPESEIP